MNESDLTITQLRVLDVIRDSLRDRGYSPTHREICAAMHWRSTAAVGVHFAALERKGFIRRRPQAPRGIELVVPDGVCAACGRAI